MDSGDCSGVDTINNCDKTIIALIDVDTLYHSMFEDFFNDEVIVISFFGLGREFLEMESDEKSKFDFVIVNHNLFDMKVVPFLENCREHILGEVCVISSNGHAVSIENKLRLNITGDFEKIDQDGILNWYHYFQKNKVEA